MASFSFPLDVLDRIRGYIPDDDVLGPTGSDKDFVRFVLSHRGVWNEASQMVADMREPWNGSLRQQEEMDREDEVEQAEQAVFLQQLWAREAMIRLFPASFLRWMAEHGHD